MKKINDFDHRLLQVTDMEVNTRDYPDFCDSYIISAEYGGRELEDEEVEWLNNESDIVYDECLNWVY